MEIKSFTKTPPKEHYWGFNNGATSIYHAKAFKLRMVRETLHLILENKEPQYETSIVMTRAEATAVMHMLGEALITPVEPALEEKTNAP